MKTKITYLLLALTLLGTSSCVRDEILPCPPLQVNITVKDKNYFNVDKVELEERLSDDLAFRTYVPTLYYMLRDVETGEVVEEQGMFEVTGDEKTFPVTFCDCIPHGKYVLTVWGGMNDETPLGNDPLTAILHAEKEQGADFYLTNDTLVYDAYTYNHTVELERTKGKLIIQVENLPNDVNYSDKTVDGLYQQVDNEVKYADLTAVYTQAEWKQQTDIVTKTILAPSQKEKGSMVQAHFYDEADRVTPTLTPKAVSVTMKRNELTVLRYVYDDGKGDFNIYVLVNDVWEMLHNMNID